MKPRDPLADAIAALDLVGAIDELQRTFCQSDLLTVDRLREAAWMQKHVDADRKVALAKLKKALNPIPFKKLPADLRWIRGEATPPCYVSEADRRALCDLIGPDPFDKNEETE